MSNILSKTIYTILLYAMIISSKKITVETIRMVSHILLSGHRMSNHGKADRFMTKNDIKRKMITEGSSFAKAFPFEKSGQECTIFKTEWPLDVAAHLDDVIYVPDICLNDIDVYSTDLTEDQINNVLSHSYTVADFLMEAHGNISLARCIFIDCDWENPDIHDVMDCTDDHEAMENFGGTWEDIETGRTADISGYENR